MSQLQDNLDEILRQKNAYLLPENIKKDVTILNVTGTYEGGGSNNVKLFETEQAMQADSNPSEGDLAVVYRSEIQNWDGQSEVSGFIVPSTVTLSSAISGDIWCYGYGNSGDLMLEGSISSNGATMRIMSYVSGGEIYATYTSSDGITYTRTDSGSSSITFDDVATFSMMDWDTVFENFLQVGGKTFDGLYEYVTNGDTDHFMTSLSSNLNIADTTVTWVESFDGPIFDWVKTKAIMKKIRAYHDTVLSTNVSNSSYFFVIINNKPAIICPVNNAGTASFYDSRPVTMFDTNGNIVGLTYCNNSHYIPSSTSNLFKFEVFYLDYDHINYETPFYVQSTYQNSKAYTNLISSIIPIIVLYDYNSARDYCLRYRELDANITTANTYARYTTTSVSISPSAYVFAETQLKLSESNQLLPSITGYGKKGVVTGDNTIYQNLPFADVATNIFNETQDGSSDAYHGANLIDYATNGDATKLSYIKKATNLVVPDGCYGHHTSTPLYVSSLYSLFVAPTGWNKTNPIFADIKQNLLFGFCYRNASSDTTSLFVVEKLDTQEVLFQQEVTYQLNQGTSRYRQDDKYVCFWACGTTYQAIYAYDKTNNQLKTILNRTGSFKSDNGYGWMYDPNSHCICYGINNSSAGYTTYITHIDTNSTTTIETSNTGALQDGNLMTNSTTLYWVYNSKLTKYNVSTKTFTRENCASAMYAGAYGTANPYALEDTYDYLFYYSHYIAKKSSPTTEYRGFLSRLIYNNEIIASSASSGYPRQKGNVVYMVIGHYLGKGQLVVSNDLSTVDIICDAVYYLPDYIPLTSYTSYDTALQNPTPDAISFVNDYIEYDYNGWSTAYEGWFKNYTLSDIDDFDYMLLPANSAGRLTGIFERVNFN